MRASAGAALTLVLLSHQFCEGPSVVALCHTASVPSRGRRTTWPSQAKCGARGAISGEISPAGRERTLQWALKVLLLRGGHGSEAEDHERRVRGWSAKRNHAEGPGEPRVTKEGKAASGEAVTGDGDVMYQQGRYAEAVERYTSALCNLARQGDALPHVAGLDARAAALLGHRGSALLMMQRLSHRCRANEIRARIAHAALVLVFLSCGFKKHKSRKFSLYT